ncbi:AfsR/SARP family transcriptional regulator [Lentzea guizhouensis]|uniref:AfsR/SARP family transcriptional regulator n=1 Tax=Lentzea guizhouensis TaxID=1586287 RepID=UPI000A75F03E|nr:BTAD domain-containing putative transcriptional regulator [Lentzea guizhouensis]
MEFRLLGAFEAWSGGARVPLGGARAECLLAVLLLERNRAVMVERLVEAAWGEQPPMTAATQVRKIVADLRRRLPGGAGLIVTDGAGYRAVVHDEQTDLGMFDRQVRLAREADDAAGVIEHLTAALSLWRGPALAGIDSPVVHAAVAVLNERRIAAADQLMETRLSMGAARELVADLRALLDEYPLRETTRCQLMLALYRSGRQAEALRVYDDGRRLLAEELGIDPGPELMQLHERILRNEPELDVVPHAPQETAVPQALPYDMADFVGRVEEQRRISEFVGDQAGKGLMIVAVDGMAGVGKTSLLVHMAHRLADGFPDGQFYVDLLGYAVDRKPMDPVEALGTVLRQAGVPRDELPDDLSARAVLWRMRTAGRQIMVLLDNVVDSAQVRALLPGSSDGLVMITSRSRLTGLDGTLSLSLAPPPTDEGLELVVGILGADRVDREPEAARELVTACDHLPLAIRIACTRLHNRERWTIRYLVDRLHDEERKMSELAVGDRSVAAAIGLSYDALEPGHQRVFRLLGLVPATEVDVHAVAALADMALTRAETVLEDLLDMRLVVQLAPGRYGLHDLVHSLARALVGRIEPAGLRTIAVHRLLDYQLCAANAAADRLVHRRVRPRPRYLYPPAQLPRLHTRSAAVTWFDAECGGLLAAVRGATDNELHDHVCHLSEALHPYLRLRGRMHDMLWVHEHSLESARAAGDRKLEGRALHRLTAPHWHFGRLGQAFECAEQALAVARETGDVLQHRVAEAVIGKLLNEFGRFTEALPYHRAAARDSHQLDLSCEVAVLVNYASAQAAVQDFSAARLTLDSALRLAKDTGSASDEVLVLARYADVCRREGNLDEAGELGSSATSLLRHLGNQAQAAWASNLLGRVHYERGELDVALERHNRARKLAEDIGFRVEIARALDGAARVLADRSDAGGAAANWRIALRHFEEMGVPEAAVVRQGLAAVS